MTWGCGLSACLLAGCLFHHSSADPPADASAKAPDAPAGRPADPPPPDVKPASNYGVLIPGPAGTAPVPSLKRVHLEVKPALPPAPPPQAPPAGPPPPPAPTDPPLSTALRRALEKDPRQALELLQRHDTPNRELLRALLRLTAGLGPGDLERLPPHEVAAALAQLHKLILALQRRAPLTLDKLCFCRKIHHFGRYDALPIEYEFQGGIDGRPGERVQVYAEVRNLSSVPRGPSYDPVYETVLATELKILEGKRPVVTMNLPHHVDRSRTPRQDFFLNCRFNVPENIPPGRYTLWVTVKDVTPAPTGTVTARVAESTLDFNVVAPGSRRPAPAAGEQGLSGR
jgi:hypothetical protein